MVAAFSGSVSRRYPARPPPSLTIRTRRRAPFSLCRIGLRLQEGQEFPAASHSLGIPRSDPCPRTNPACRLGHAGVLAGGGKACWSSAWLRPLERLASTKPSRQRHRHEHYSNEPNNEKGWSRSACGHPATVLGASCCGFESLLTEVRSYGPGNYPDKYETFAVAQESVIRCNHEQSP